MSCFSKGANPESNDDTPSGALLMDFLPMFILPFLQASASAGVFTQDTFLGALPIDLH